MDAWPVATRDQLIGIIERELPGPVTNKAMTIPISRAEIIAAYRAFLGRDPENDEVIEYHMNLPSLEQLLSGFISSEEFRERRQLGFKPLYWAPVAVEVDIETEELRRLHDEVRATWTRLGNEEPYWSVVTDESFRADRSSANLSSFYEGGARAVEEFEAFAMRSGNKLSSEQTCFELGCGVGRMTASLAPRFSRVVAADISASHLNIAQSALSEKGITNVTFRHLATPDALEALPGFDVFVSLIVLQHNPPPIMAFMLRTILEILRPDGIAYFQLPTYLEGYSFNIKAYLSSEMLPRGIEMHVLPQQHVFDIIRVCNCRVLEVREDGWTGIANCISNTFLVQKIRPRSWYRRMV
jgi:2-polyprenyl-3-methyl-5-hydroxy-6-metoxy-1,4-benzoquinol methylase